MQHFHCSVCWEQRLAYPRSPLGTGAVFQIALRCHHRIYLVTNWDLCLQIPFLWGSYGKENVSSLKAVGFFRTVL